MCAFVAFSPASDAWRTFFGRFADGRVLYWDQSGLFAVEEATHGVETDRLHPVRDKILVP